MWELDGLARELGAAAPDIERLRRENAELATRLRTAARHAIDSVDARVANAAIHLAHLSPQRVLERGYAIVESNAGVVRESAKLATCERLKLTFAQGWATAKVVRRREDESS